MTRFTTIQAIRAAWSAELFRGHKEAVWFSGRGLERVGHRARDGWVETWPAPTEAPQCAGCDEMIGPPHPVLAQVDDHGDRLCGRCDYGRAFMTRKVES